MLDDYRSFKLSDYQDLVAELVVLRGFEKETITEVFSLLVEEVGELAKAMRKFNGQKVDLNSKEHSIEGELADIFWLLLDISNRLNIDLAEAFSNKEKINRKRVWQ